MSDSDSFIEEVTEEVRRDRLFGLMRRYGWIAILVVVVLVGGAAFFEYRKAQDRAAAEALGDAVMTALNAPDATARASALAEVSADAAAAPVLSLLQTAADLQAENPTAAAEKLTALAGDTSIPAIYSDLAALKLVMLGGDAVDAATAAQLIDRLSVPGAPFRLLALEQRALAQAAAGETEAAIETAQALLQEQGLTPNLENRLSQLIIALGGTPELQSAG